LSSLTLGALTLTSGIYEQGLLHPRSYYLATIGNRAEPELVDQPLRHWPCINPPVWDAGLQEIFHLLNHERVVRSLGVVALVPITTAKSLPAPDHQVAWF
jgi:hypothetical protein